MKWRETRKRHDVLTIPTIWLAALLSLLIHVAALWFLLPRLHQMFSEGGVPRPDVLAVQLAPPSTPSAPPAAAPAPQQPPPATQRKETKATPPRPVPKKPAPPMIALDKQAQIPQIAPLPEPVPAPPTVVAPPPTPPAQDLAAYIDAKRRARGEAPVASTSSAPSEGQETDEERRNRIVAANTTGTNRVPTFGRDPRNAGGIFEIREMGYDYAQFYFFGFDKDIARNARQLVDVRKGSNSDIRIAVVRRMIEIIRENVSDEFQWISQRLGRQVRLSARPADNAELENFIMRDVFPDGRAP